MQSPVPSHSSNPSPIHGLNHSRSQTKLAISPSEPHTFNVNKNISTQGQTKDLSHESRDHLQPEDKVKHISEFDNFGREAASPDREGCRLSILYSNGRS